MKWIALWVDDFLAGTSSLTATETGVFCNLVCHMTSKDGVVPDDDRTLHRRIAKVSIRQWRAIKRRLIEGSFIGVDGFIRQDRVERELERTEKLPKNQRCRVQRRRASRAAKSLNGQHSPDTVVYTAAYTAVIPTRPRIDIPLTNVRGASARPPDEVEVEETTPAEVTPAEVNLGAAIFGPCRQYLVANGVRTCTPAACSVAGGRNTETGRSSKRSRTLSDRSSVRPDRLDHESSRHAQRVGSVFKRELRYDAGRSSRRARHPPRELRHRLA